jgi:hypothetical protein
VDLMATDHSDRVGPAESDGRRRYDWPTKAASWCVRSESGRRGRDQSTLPASLAGYCLFRSISPIGMRSLPQRTSSKLPRVQLSYLPMLLAGISRSPFWKPIAPSGTTRNLRWRPAGRTAFSRGLQISAITCAATDKSGWQNQLQFESDAFPDHREARAAVGANHPARSCRWDRQARW